MAQTQRHSVSQVGGKASLRENMWPCMVARIIRMQANISEGDAISYYGRITDIIELNYNGAFKVFLFKCDWYDVHHRVGTREDEFGFTLLNFSWGILIGNKLMDDPFVFSSQVEQVFYVQDLFDMGKVGDEDDEI